MEHPLTGYLNSYADSENKRHILGAELYNFLIFCKVNIPQDASYDYYSATQDKKDNEALVYARYFLYPLRRIVSDPDYKIYYRSDPLNESGYKLFKTFRDFGVILKKEQ